VFVRCLASFLVAVGVPAIVGCQDLQSGASNIYQRAKIAVAGDDAQQQAAASAPTAPTKGSGRGLVENTGNGDYRASCRNFVAMAAEKQETDVWCWAACVQMVSEYGGRKVSQAEIAGRIHGKATDANGNLIPEKVKRAGTMEIMVALNPEFQDQVTKDLSQQVASGKVKDVDFDYKAVIEGFVLEKSYNVNDLIGDVAKGSPVVVGLKDPGGKTGHAYVVYAASYHADQGGVGAMMSPVQLKAVEAVDPWDGKSVTITGADFQSRVGFMISKDRSREVLQKYRSAASFN